MSRGTCGCQSSCWSWLLWRTVLHPWTFARMGVSLTCLAMRDWRPLHSKGLTIPVPTACPEVSLFIEHFLGDSTDLSDASPSR